MRNIMRLAATAALGAVIAPATISAADTVDWTGPSLGIHAAYVDYSSTWNDQDYDWNGGAMVFANRGFMAGASVGYDYQIGKLVIGGAYDWDRAAIKAAWRYSDDDNVSNEVDSIRCLRIRAGVAAEATLLYVTAGVAKGSFAHSWNEDGDPTDSWHSFDNNSTGYVLGLGVEQRVAQNWSVSAELLSYTFGEEYATNEDGYTMRVKDELLTARVGASYRF